MTDDRTVKFTKHHSQKTNDRFQNLSLRLQDQVNHPRIARFRSSRIMAIHFDTRFKKLPSDYSDILKAV